MSNFLLMAMPFAGHVAPIVAVAERLVQRGHDVRVYTGRAYRQRVDAVGARWVGWRQAPDFDEHKLEATFPRLKGKPGPRQVFINLSDLFISTAPGQVGDLDAEWNREPWDVLVGEDSTLAPGLVAERLGCRWATVAILPLGLPSKEGPPNGLGLAPGVGPIGRGRDALLRWAAPVFGSFLKPAVRRARVAVGLEGPVPRFDRAVYSSQLILASGASALDYYRRDRPSYLHWVGVLAGAPAAVDPATAAPQATVSEAVVLETAGPEPTEPETAALETANPVALPIWWRDLEGKRVVYVTQGTLNIDPTALLRPTLDALADLDVIVVATTGRRGHDTLPFEVPQNARIAGFIPHDLLLPRVDAMVTNGGWGGTLSGLAQGLPLVIAGGDLDKPEVAARVAATGAGVNLHTGRPTKQQLREAVEEVFDKAHYRSAASRVARELREAGGVERAVSLLETIADR